jgi:predicted component of type VI protein secretion system
MATIAKKMKSNKEQPTLNAAQLDFLQTLSFVKSEQEVNDLRKLVRDYYAEQLQKEADRLWDEGTINYHLLDEHLRTAYK